MNDLSEADKAVLRVLHEAGILAAALELEQIALRAQVARGEALSSLQRLNQRGYLKGTRINESPPTYVGPALTKTGEDLCGRLFPATS